MLSDEQRSTLRKLLGPLELKVMEVLWEREQATVQEVVDRLPQERKYAYTTVMTVMGRLAEKGILARVKRGRKYIYHPSVPPERLVEQSTSRAIRGLLEDFGDVALSQFVDAVGDAPEQLEKLKALIDRMEGGEDGK